MLRSDIVIAYADTDGTGQRADRRPPGPESHYIAIDKAITEITGKPRDETVVLTADYSFLAFYPYYGFRDSPRTMRTRWHSSTSARPRSRAGKTCIPPTRWCVRSTPCRGGPLPCC